MKQNYPALNKVFNAVIKKAPAHERFLKNSLKVRDATTLEFSENLAQKIITLLGNNFDNACDDYVWTCGQKLEEEIHFRRYGDYRNKVFSEVLERVYSNSEFMPRYLNGILMSQVLWSNHINSMYFYNNYFLGELTHGSNHLEIGPGHGLLLYLAKECNKKLNLTALDISEISLKQTRHCFNTMAAGTDLNLIQADIMNKVPLEDKFDSVVMSEIMEHLEQPSKALEIIKTYFKPRGHLYLNVPINSPAPDHIYLFTTPQELSNMVLENGFEIIKSKNIPMTGHSLQTCLDKKMSVSCLIHARLK